MKNFFISLLKMIIVVLIIFIIPFILPIILKLFLNLNIFANIDEFKNIINIFNSVYTFIYILIGIVMLLWFFHRWETVKDFIKNTNFSFAFGDKKISAEHMKEEIKNISEQKDFINKIAKENNDNDSKNIINEVKMQLGMSKNSSKTECKECNKKEIEEENRKLRDFATYNMINTDAKRLLHIIYNEKYMETGTFKSRIIQGYKKRNRKNIKFTKKEIDKIAKNKYDTIFAGLKFLNIIEPSEDDKIVKLTQHGKQFVEKYIEKKEVV